MTVRKRQRLAMIAMGLVFFPTVIVGVIVMGQLFDPDNTFIQVLDLALPIFVGGFLAESVGKAIYDP